MPPSSSRSSAQPSRHQSHSTIALPGNHQLFRELLHASNEENRCLQKQLHDLEEMYTSALQDLQWHIETLAQYDNRLGSVEADLNDASAELDEAEKNLRILKDALLKKKSKDAAKKPSKKTVSLTVNEYPGGTYAMHIPATATSFIFCPKTSLITFPDAALAKHALEFPGLHSLLDIHRRLHAAEEAGISPLCRLVLKICRARGALGIALPELSRERMTGESVEIGMPSVVVRPYKGKGKAKAATKEDDVDIAEWQVVDDIRALELEAASTNATTGSSSAESSSTSISTSISAGKVKTRDFGPAPVQKINPIRIPTPKTPEPFQCGCNICDDDALSSPNTPKAWIRGGGDDYWDGYDYYDNSDYENSGTYYDYGFQGYWGSDPDPAMDGVSHEDEAREPWAEPKWQEEQYEEDDYDWCGR